ncbi:blue copper protein-like [Rosa rugosa]|uniref:blue copper protein-like n=1 Tax=Rosa rugosa TaxID=74645 RepID=UPI002B4071D5|nr:blue copper protein-like [Rosa rugosa]
MALANIPMLLSLLMALCGVCFGTIYQVGDSNGWTDKGVDYKTWASTKNFTVGDILHFKYDRKENNVVRVLHKAFRSCNPKGKIYKTRTGDDYIRLNRPGNFFFICSVNGHCRSGQKVHVSVSKSVPSVSPGTAPTLPPVPSSSPLRSPIASPTSPTATPTGAPKGAPIASPKGAPIASPKGAPTAAPKGAPTAAPTTPPTADGPPSADSPPDLPIELIPAPKAPPPNPPKKSSAQSIHSSMLFLMAMGFIAYIVV